MLRGFALVLFVLAACAPATGPEAQKAKFEVKDWGSVNIRLGRGMCYGTCPMYEVEIRGDGTVTYCGLGYVREVGERTRTISPSEVASLLNKFADVEFFDLDAQYVHGPTDGAMFGVSLSYDGREKDIAHYSGSNQGTALLGQLEDAIDQAAGIEEWVGSDDKRTGPPQAIPDCARRFGVELPEQVLPIPL